ncbi:hypothetical protein BH23DEI1_BH23DEI1_01080 [soil metagenome]
MKKAPSRAPLEISIPRYAAFVKYLQGFMTPRPRNGRQDLANDPNGA